VLPVATAIETAAGGTVAKGLDPASGLPAYRQIANRLRERIASGELGPDDRLPSEAELMETYSAARATVRQAVGVLRSEGLVVAEQGRGAFVRRRPPVRRLAQDRFARRHREEGRAAFTAEMEGRRPAVEVLAVEAYAPPAEVAERLGLAEDAKVLRRFRRYLDGGLPLEIATSYIPWSIAEGTPMVETNPGPGGIYARIEEQGRRLGRFTEDVTARMPTVEEAHALQLPAGTPVLHLVRTAYDTDGTAVEVCDTVMAADRHVLSYELPAR
jgi:GntR family transcriptional regulator